MRDTRQGIVVKDDLQWYHLAHISSMNSELRAARYRGVYKYAIFIKQWQKSMCIYNHVCTCAHTHCQKISKVLCYLNSRNCQMHFCFYTFLCAKVFNGIEEQRVLAGGSRGEEGEHFTFKNNYYRPGFGGFS